MPRAQSEKVLLNSVGFAKRLKDGGAGRKKGQSSVKKTAKELATEFQARQSEAARNFKPRAQGKLSNEQLTAAKAVFQQIDKDHSGTIDMDELLNWFKLSGKDISREEVRKIMYEADRGQDNRIDLREFLDIFVMAISPSTQRDEAVESIKEVLDAYGEKGKNQIKKAELIRMLNEQYDLEIDVSFVDGLMKDAWKGSAKGSFADLEDSLDEFVTLEELKRALGI